MMSRILSRLSEAKRSDFDEEDNNRKSHRGPNRKTSDYKFGKNGDLHFSNLFSNVLDEFKYQREDGNLFMKLSKMK